MRIKNSKWARIAIGAVLVIAVALLGVALSQQMGSRRQVEAELADAESSLDQFEAPEAVAQRRDMQQRITDALARLDSARAELSQTTDSIIVNEALFNIAVARDVVVTSIITSPETVGQLGELDCTLLPLSMSVEGSLAAILDFVTGLNDVLTNGAVELADITVPTEGQPVASLEMVVYTYEGE